MSTAVRPRPVTRLTPRPPARRTVWKPVLVLVLVTALVAGAVWLVRYSSVFATRHVRVVGVSRLTPQQVTDAAQVPMGVPLIGIDNSRVGRRVATLPEVAEVTVYHQWPDTIRIKVTERTPVFVLTGAGEPTLVDLNGIMFGRAPAPKKNRAPGDLVPARSSSTDAEQLADIATVIDSLPPALRDRTLNVTAASKDTITLHLTKNDQVVWGSAENSARKGEVAVALLTHKGRIYNVTVPAHPTIKA